MKKLIHSHEIELLYWSWYLIINVFKLVSFKVYELMKANRKKNN